MINSGLDRFTCSKGRKENKIEYLNIPAAFDIETSSFYHNKIKHGCMYIWQLGISGYNYTGRTWDEFIDALEALRDAFDLSEKKRLVIYVHNLSYEFQWMHKHLDLLDVFALDDRKVAYCITSYGIEFRCSYILTGKSLQMVGEDLTIIKCEKLHTLDYKLVRLPTTYISPEEMDYCINDIKVVQNLIYEKILQDGSIAKIPLTKTGYVRRFLKSKCLYGDKKSHKHEAGRQYTAYRRIMAALTLDGYKEYKLCRDAFMGGYTHSNPHFTRKRVKGRPFSIDFTSDYPYQMIAHKHFPMSKGEFVRPRTRAELEHNLKYYCCIFEVRLFDVEATFFDDFYIPFSKCRAIREYHLCNGRVVSAKELTMTLTEIDFEIICATYKFNWEKLQTGYFVRYRRGYLPTPLVEGVLELYRDKTELKGIPEKEAYYQLRKELLNSCYGAIVTDILRLMQVYDNQSKEWRDPTAPEAEKEIEKYNTKKDRFLFYPWGVYVTALARRSLWSGILEFREDYIYSDTDSIKGLNYEKHKRYIENYNRHCKVLLEEAMKHHGLSLDLCHPKTQKGAEKWLGVWDFEGFYDEDGFKTLGSKRYMTLHDGELSITVSGLNKKVTVPYLLKKYKTIDKCFDVFDDELTVPAGQTGKLTHTYIDEECKGYIKDYLGKMGHYEELSYIHLEDQEYNLGMKQLIKDSLYLLDRYDIA